MGRVARSYFTREDNEGTYGGAYGQKESMLEISDTSQVLLFSLISISLISGSKVLSLFLCALSVVQYVTFLCDYV
ncbi:hypothetical protein P8452_60795 [Trifolium repens]|nr:hypothetical protein P8452_60795 [Trifolium repens]